MVATFRDWPNKKIKSTSVKQISLKLGWRRTNVHLVEKWDIIKMSAHMQTGKMSTEP